MTNDTEYGQRLNPLRLPKNREESERGRDLPYVGVSGSLYKGDEGTITLSVGGDTLHMDVEYAKLIVVMLAEVIKSVKEHNAALPTKD